MESADQSHRECLNLLRPVRDALDVLAGKWKLPIIVALTFGEKRFGEIANEVQGITDRMLSKELRDMELNGLVKRRVYEQYPVKVTYTLTAHGQTLNEVIDALHHWGALHRKKILWGVMQRGLASCGSVCLLRNASICGPRMTGREASDGL